MRQHGADGGVRSINMKDDYFRKLECCYGYSKKLGWVNFKKKQGDGSTKRWVRRIALVIVGLNLAAVSAADNRTTKAAGLYPVEGAELAKVWVAAETMGGLSGAFFKCLILTGQRRDEVSGMRWADLDLEAKVWTLPREATKGDRSHEVPLAPLTIEVLTALPRTGEYVFSSTRGEKPTRGYSKIKARAEKLAGFDDWRIHDLRRSAGTGMARAECNL
jgi:integrase